MPKYNVKFKFPIPDRYQEDVWDQGLTDEYLYDGPEYLCVDLDEVTGKVDGHSFYQPEELERPIGLDDYRLTLDCKDEPMLCDILDERDDTTPWDLGFWPHPDDSIAIADTYQELWIKAPDGYEDVLKPKRCIPREVYRKDDIYYDFEKEEFKFVIDTSDRPPMDTTWDDVRSRRDSELQNTDSRISSDMPEETQEKWKIYRQKLRDLPAAMQENSILPWQALMMFPDEPK